jgi:hypothetical protein
MLIVIGLLAAFGIMAERVVRLSLHTLNKAEVEQDELIRTERAMHALRADVWGARGMEVIDKKHVRMADVEWACEAGGDVTRTEKGEEQRWAKLGVEFARDGGWLVVKRNGVEVEIFQQADSFGEK